MRAKMPNRNSNLGFVADGRQRWETAQLATLESEVAARFEQSLATAGFFRRILIWTEIRKEVRRQMSKHAPSNRTLW